MTDEETAAVKHRLEALHGELAEQVRHRRLTRDEIGKMLAFETAIQLLEASEEREVKPVEESPNPDRIRELIEVSRTYREEDSLHEC